MRKLGLLEVKITLVDKPDTILEFIRELKATRRISDEEEMVLINGFYNKIPEFLPIQNEFESEIKEDFNDTKYLLKFKNYLSITSQALRATVSCVSCEVIEEEGKTEKKIRSSQDIRPLDPSLEQKVRMIGMSPQKRPSQTLQQMPSLNLKSKESSFKVSSPKPISQSTATIQPVDLHKSRQFGSFFRQQSNEEEMFTSVGGCTYIRWNKYRDEIESYPQNYILNFLCQDKKRVEDIQQSVVLSVTNKYKELKRAAIDISKSLMIPSAQEFHLYSLVSFLKVILKAMFKISDFEVTKIDASSISLFRSHSITIASGDIREDVRVKNLSIFEKDRLYLLGSQEMELIHDCIIGEISSPAYFLKKFVDGNTFLVFFLMEKESKEFNEFLFENRHGDKFQKILGTISEQIITLLTQKITDKNKFILRLFQIVEDYLQLQHLLLIYKFQDSFFDLFETQLFLYDNMEIDEDRREIIAEILNGNDADEEDVKISYDFAIYNTEFKFYSFLNRSHLIRSIYYKHFENVATQIFHKHRHVINRLLDRFTDWKMSLGFNQVLYFEFNKTGALSFLNRAPSQKLRKQSKMILPENLQGLHFSMIFKDNEIILQAIKESLIQKQYSIHKNDQSSEEVEGNARLQYQIAAEPGVKGKIKIVKLNLVDPSKEEEGEIEREKCQSPIFHSSQKTNNHKIKNKLAYFTASESKNIILHDNDAKNTTVVEFLSQIEQRKVNEEQKALYFKKLSSPSSQQIQRRNIRCIAEVNNEVKGGGGSYLNKLFTVRKVTEKNDSGNKTDQQLKPEDFKIEESLSGELDSFAINVWKYSEQTKLKVVWTLMQKQNYFETFSIPIEEFICFLYRMREKYNKRDNPFHNFDHAIMVMHGCYMIGCKTDANKYLNKTQEFSLVFSGLCHDASHRARTNAFEVNTMSKLAIRYHDQSVLEQHHIATTFKLLRQSSANIFKQLTIQKVQEIRKYVINNILATDMSKHFDFLKDFQLDFLQESLKKSISDLEEKEINLLTGTIIHTSDFHHTAQKFELSRQWSVKVNKEFSQQYIEEGRQGVQQTPYLKDLDKMHVIAKNEAGFIKMIVKPLWETMNKFLNNQLQEPVANLEQSILEWNKLQEQAQKEEEENQRLQELNKLKQTAQSGLNSKLKKLI